MALPSLQAVPVTYSVLSLLDVIEALLGGLVRVSLSWQMDDVGDDGDSVNVVVPDDVVEDAGRVVAAVVGVLDVSALPSSVFTRVKVPVTMPPPITVMIAIFIGSDCELNQCFRPMRRSMPS